MIVTVKRHLKTFGLAAVIMLSGCASVLDQDGALAVSPYDIDANGRIVVDVQVNGNGPFEFALDTAASISVVFDELRDELALQPEPGKTVIIHGTVASGRFPILSVDFLEVGREVWIKPRLASMPSKTDATTGIDGILGVDFLRRYAVGFSTRDRVVRLYPPDLVGRRSYRGWASVPLIPQYIGTSGAALFLFEIEINDQTIPAVFDLGAGMNMMNWSAAHSLGIEPADLLGDDSFSGVIDTTTGVGWIRAERVTTGRIRWRNEVFSVAELNVFASFLKEDDPCAVLGAGLFNQRDFIIDFPRSRLLIKVAMDEVDLSGAEDGSHLSSLAPVRNGLVGMHEQHNAKPGRKYPEHESARRKLNNAMCNRSLG